MSTYCDFSLQLKNGIQDWDLRGLPDPQDESQTGFNSAAIVARSLSMSLNEDAVMIGGDQLPSGLTYSVDDKDIPKWVQEEIVLGYIGIRPQSNQPAINVAAIANDPRGLQGNAILRIADKLKTNPRLVHQSGNAHNFAKHIVQALKFSTRAIYDARQIKTNGWGLMCDTLPLSYKENQDALALKIALALLGKNQVTDEMCVVSWTWNF